MTASIPAKERQNAARLRARDARLKRAKEDIPAPPPSVNMVLLNQRVKTVEQLNQTMEFAQYHRDMYRGCLKHITQLTKLITQLDDVLIDVDDSPREITEDLREIWDQIEKEEAI